MKKRWMRALAAGAAALLLTAAGCGFVNEQDPVSRPAAEAPKAEAVELTGSWDCIVEADGQTYLLRFAFAEDGSMTYHAGWYRSEWAATYDGSYTQDGATVSMALVCNEDGSTLDSVFTAAREGDVLSLTLQSGDATTYVQQAGETLDYTPTEEE